MQAFLVHENTQYYHFKVACILFVNNVDQIVEEFVRIDNG
jgi:hypothetical protein